MNMMNKIFWMAWYDLKGQLRERGTVLIVGSVVVLACFGLLQGARHAAAMATAATAATAQQERALTKAKAYSEGFFADPNKPEHVAAKSYKNPADIRGYAFREYLGFAVKPALPGAALAIGQSDVLPAYVRVKVESMDSARTHYEIEHPARLASGRFDLSFVVLYLWPLALLTLCLSALTHDRETLRTKTLAIEGVRPFSLLITQVLARTLSATVLFVLLTMIVALGSGALPSSMAGLAAAAMWGIITMAYSAFWAGVCVAIGALCQSRATAAFAAFGAWLVIAVMLPNLTSAAANLLAPMPSREAYIVASRDAADALNADRLNMVTRFYDQHPEWKPDKTALDKISPTVTRLARAVEMEKSLAKVDAIFNDAKNKQRVLLDTLSLFSPLNLAQESLTSLAGNDLSRHDRFMVAVQQHQVALRDLFQPLLQVAAKKNEATPCAHASGTCMEGFGFTAHDCVSLFRAPSNLNAPDAPAGTSAFMLGWAALLVAAAAIRLRGAAAGGGSVSGASNAPIGQTA